MRLSAQSKNGLGRFGPDLIVVLDWFGKLVVALGATTKSYDKWSGSQRSRPLMGVRLTLKSGVVPKVPPNFHALYRMGTWCPSYFFTNYRVGLWGPPYNLSVVIGVARGATPINSHPHPKAEGRIQPSAGLRVGSRRRRHRAR